MTRTIYIAAALALAATLPIAQAQAQANRTFVSAAGSDSNNCANSATPCRHFQTAVNATAVGGEVVALDPANYGSITISHTITIEGQGWSYIAPPTGGNGITINAVSGSNVTIRGVLLNGAGITGETNGILFKSGASLTVTDCVILNFSGSGSGATGNGIAMQPTSGSFSFVITNTTASNNGYAGVSYFPQSGTATANGVIDHVVAANNTYGITLFTGSGAGSTTVAISNSIASNNNPLATGIFITSVSSPFAVSIDNCNISGNGTGIFASDAAKVLLGRSVITSNSISSIENDTSSSTFYTYQNNQINLNGNGNTVIGHALVALPFQ
jgi:hypothetical protein